MDHLGGNKGVSIYISKLKPKTSFVVWNKTEPWGYKSISQIWNVAKKNVSYTIKNIGKRLLLKIAKLSSRYIIAKIAKAMIDLSNGKKVNIRRY